MPDHQSSIFGVGHIQSSLLLSAAPPEPQAFTEKYRPATLADLVGQGAAVHQLQQFVETPYATAFLFEGETGTGKTSAALALAHDLGVNPHWALHRIKSGLMDAEAVEGVIRGMRFLAPGNGWKVIIADEADSMSPKARQLWLSVLEEIPGKNVIIFTTNHPDKFEQRFADRCERVKFESDAALLAQDAQAARQGRPAVAHPVPPPAAAGKPATAPEPPFVPFLPLLTLTDVPAGYRPKADYRLAASHLDEGCTRKVWVNPTGWRFEFVQETPGKTQRAVTHSEKVGARWVAALATGPGTPT